MNCLDSQISRYITFFNQHDSSRDRGRHVSATSRESLEIQIYNKTRGPFLERPDNLPGPKSYFEM